MIFETRTGLSRRRNKTHRDLRVESLEPRMLLACNVISGFVYDDANNNGLFDPGETPIANSTIELRNASGVVVGRTTTDASGAYRFDTDQHDQHRAGFDHADRELRGRRRLHAHGRRESVQSGPGNLDLGRDRQSRIHPGPDQVRVPRGRAGPDHGEHRRDVEPELAGVGIVAAQIDESRTFNATAFDGILDFAGTSGVDFGSIRVDNTETATLTSASDLAAYTGTGTITFTLSGLVATSGTGAANLANQRSATAGADVTVIYRYTPSNCLSPGNYTIVQTTQPPGFDDGLESRDGVVIPGSVGTDVIPVTLGNVDLPNNNFGELRSSRRPDPAPAEPARSGAEQPLGLRLFRREQQRHLGVARIRHRQRDGDLDRHEQPGPVGHPRDDDRRGRLLLVHHASPGTYTITETQPTAFITGKDTIGTLGGITRRNQFSQITLPAGWTAPVQFRRNSRKACKLNHFNFNAARGRTLPARPGPQIRFYLPGMIRRPAGGPCVVGRRGEPDTTCADERGRGHLVMGCPAPGSGRPDSGTVSVVGPIRSGA